MWQQYLEEIRQGNIKSLSRSISLVENEYSGYAELLAMLPNQPSSKIIGITGPPGAGKSTLVNAMIRFLTGRGKRVAVLCIDPSSPFNLGALLGDRIRMNAWYAHPGVYIRSLASRGSLGGLHPKMIEITDLLKAAPFDHIIVETVGVGQSEVEIAGLADTTVVVMVPEAGDEIQTMKAGMMEIADVFVVNKADRPGADDFVRNLRQMMAPAYRPAAQRVPVIKTVASVNQGIEELMEKIMQHEQAVQHSDRKLYLLAERAYHLIQSQRMRDVNKQALKDKIAALVDREDFNLYQFVRQY